MNPHRVPWHYRARRAIILSILRAVFRLLSKVKITGSENIPLGKPYIVAMNHVSIFDPPLAASFWPEELEIIGAEEVFSRPGQGLVLKFYGVIRVHRGDYDRALLTKLIHILKSGFPLLIAPEGSRSHVTAMNRAKPGIAYLIEQTGVPVVPVGIVGTTPDLMRRALKGPRPALEVRIGKPITLPPIEVKGTERHEMRQKNADLVMSHLAGLLPEEYWGAYAGSAIRPA